MKPYNERLRLIDKAIDDSHGDWGKLGEKYITNAVACFEYNR